MILDSTVKEPSADVAGELQNAFQVSALRGQWLVLAENDPAILRRLGEALGEEALLFPIDWRDSESCLETLKAEFGERCRIAPGAQLVLVGSSRWGLQQALGSANGADGDQVDEGEGREFERWIAGASRMQQQLQQSKRQFAAAVQSFVEKMQEEVPAVTLQGRLQTLFYQAEAGLFLEYDWGQWQFRPVN